MWQLLLIVGIAAVVLIIGRGWGVIAIQGSSIEREKNPVLFGMVFGVGLADPDRHHHRTVNVRFPSILDIPKTRLFGNGVTSALAP